MSFTKSQDFARLNGSMELYANSCDVFDSTKQASSSIGRGVGAPTIADPSAQAVEEGLSALQIFEIVIGAVAFIVLIWGVIAGLSACCVKHTKELNLKELDSQPEVKGDDAEKTQSMLEAESEDSQKTQFIPKGKSGDAAAKPHAFVPDRHLGLFT